MNLFAKARSWLGSQAANAAGVSVTYVRGATELSLTAIVGRTVFSSINESGPRVEFGDRDYIIEAADLTIGEPAIGDRIKETIDGTLTTFEVMSPNTGEPSYRWSDPGRTRWRIHTKKVA